MLMAALAAEAVVFRVSEQDIREREGQLLRVGEAYRQAIKDYYESTPGSVKSWPRSLEELTYDRRFVGIKRHLREIYPDPITRTMNWGLVTSADGGIQGVYSTSLNTPIQTASIELDDVTLPAIAQYVDRRFEYVPAESSPKR
jgi:type II secretory pathway pseudopilin PulG